jgi:hypothetical protein
MPNSSAAAESGATIGEVAARTGATVEQLRTWERRFGFPQPARDRAGRRRYDETTVRRVADVLARRASGQSVRTAVDAVCAEPTTRPSLFETVRGAAPHLAPIRLGVPAMRALSHAIEDSCLAHPGDGVLLATFQRAVRFRAVAARWHELARTLPAVVAFADFGDPEPTASPARVHVTEVSPLRREWAVVCRTRAIAACLVGWERPADGTGPSARAFESLWTTDPDVVGAAVAALAAVAEEADGALAERIRRPLGAGAPGRAADELTARAVRFLDPTSH